VVASREDDDLCFRDHVDEAVLIIDPPGPRYFALFVMRSG
jgi:hypothetical protein